MRPKISDIISFFESEYTDIRRQSSWDFSGAQVLTGDREVNKIFLSLDPDTKAIREAINMGCELLITHHPLFFRESKGLFYGKSVDARAIDAIKGGLDILSYHTNIDIDPKGTNGYLCSLLGGKAEKGFIEKEGSIDHYKFSIFVPYDHKEVVLTALREAGAGKMGNYTGCGFMSEGVGMFTPNDEAEPFIGEPGVGAVVDEVKIETIVDSRLISKVISAAIKAHPYEMPAFDVIKLEKAFDYGVGLFCSFDTTYTLPEFIDHIKSKLQIKDIRTNLEDIEPFSRIGICSGSGASLWKGCLNKGVNVLLTGDMKYHDALDSGEAGVCIIDAGHEGTEAIFLNQMAEVIKNKFQVEIFINERKSQIINWG